MHIHYKESREVALNRLALKQMVLKVMVDSVKVVPSCYFRDLTAHYMDSVQKALAKHIDQVVLGLIIRKDK